MLYKKGRYRVEVGDDGAIKVKKGDWLSKYSAAIYGDFTRFHDFARRDKSGRLLPIQNPDVIRAGELIFHLPTCGRPLRMRPIVVAGRPAASAPRLSDAEKKRIVVGMLKEDFNLRGEHLPILSTAIDIVGYTEGAITLAEIAGLIAASGTLSILAALLDSITRIIAIINCAEFGYRITGMRAVAYGATAWAFDDPMPPYPSVWRHNVFRSYGEGDLGQEEARLREKAWTTSRDSVVESLEKEVVKRKVQKKSYQVLLRAVGHDSRKALVAEIMKGLETKVRGGFERDAFWGTELDYPN